MNTVVAKMKAIGATSVGAIVVVVIGGPIGLAVGAGIGGAVDVYRSRRRVVVGSAAPQASDTRRVLRLDSKVSAHGDFGGLTGECNDLIKWTPRQS